MRTDNELTYNFEFLKPGIYATADEVEDLAPPMTIKEAANMARRFMNALPDDMVDGDLGSGL